MLHPRFFHATGMGRSGTTLLDKLLSNHPQCSALSQPFPPFFVEAKRQFLSTIGRNDGPYPLSHYFPNRYYGIEDVTRFLPHCRFTAAAVCALVKQVQHFPNQSQLTRDQEHRLSEVVDGTMLDVLKQLLFLLRHRDEAALFGSKEIHTEEFVPFLCSAGFKCLLVIRDPRDVISSFNFGRGKQYGGELRPTLFYVRNWRKSVSMKLMMEDHPDFLAIRYEDLVTHTEKTLQQVAEFLTISQFPAAVLKGDLRDQGGQVWVTNSSHSQGAGISTSSISSYRKHLPESVRDFVEATCFPEMNHLGYDCSLDADGRERAVAEFDEPFSITRSNFSRDYSTAKERLAEERQRLQLLEQPDLSAEQQQYFLSPSVHQKLRDSRETKSSVHQEFKP